jgi:hypothetical protein
LEYLEPARTDSHQYRRALRERLIDGLRKVLAWSNVFNVHEDTMDAREGAQVIGDAAGVGSCIVAPIIDEDVVRGGGLFEEDFRRFPRLVPIGLQADRVVEEGLKRTVDWYRSVAATA